VARDARRGRLELAVQYAAPRAGLPARASIGAWLAAALPRRRARITVRFVGGAEGRRLNRDFRGRDHATNVLSFGYGGPARRGQRVLTGDIVLCRPVLVREARARGASVRAHCAHLAVHGALHLAGLDHERDRDAAIMAAAERRILARLGFPDPYPG
jgi:probable rRNA maturation factor